MGISDSPLCSYCKLENETIQHLFLECHMSKTLWLNLTNLFRTIIMLPILDAQCVVFGILNTTDKDNLILNNILLMYKLTLYKNRMKNTITLNNVLHNLRSRENIEKSLVFNNQENYDFHNRKWKKISALFI